MTAAGMVVFGSINADLVFRMEQVPAPGQTLLAERLTMQPGGKGANQAVAAARDGAAVHMVGAVGDDPLAAVALEGLQAAGVELGGVRRLAGAATGCASICTDRDGRNQIAVALGANGQARADQVGAGLLGPEATVVLQMEGAVAEIATVMRRARAAGCRVVLNLAPYVALGADVLRLADLLIVNEDEAAGLAAALGCEADAAALHGVLGAGVIRTLGADGAEAATGDGCFWAAAARVAVVDTTAAGDCFVGVLAAALSRGAPLADALRRGCVAAALACTVAGSQRSLPGSGAIDALMAELDG